MTETTRLLLIRHGEATGNAELRFLGTTDAPLTARGQAQALALAEACRALPLAAIYTSPLRRARAVADLLAAPPDRLPIVVPDLREQDFGAWENRTRAEIVASDPATLLAWERDVGIAPPGGESLAAVMARVVSAVAAIAARHASQTAVIVAHVGPIKAIICDVLGLPPEGARRMWLDPAGISLIEWDAATGRRVLRLFNATSPR
jgi:broad specificity phosphatase PhoE